MTEENYEVVESTEKKGSRTLWIILAIVAVVLIACCCLVILTALVIGIFGYATTGPYSMLNPLLSLAFLI